MLLAQILNQTPAQVKEKDVGIKLLFKEQSVPLIFQYFFKDDQRHRFYKCKAHYTVHHPMKDTQGQMY